MLRPSQTWGLGGSPKVKVIHVIMCLTNCSSLVHGTILLNCPSTKLFFLYPGVGGVGKSTSLKQLALLWTNRESEELKQFDIVFHIALKSVKQGESIADVILKQHKGLKRQNVTANDVGNILNDTNQKVLLMLDGHDEYTPGTSVYIDTAICRDSLPNCCIVLTSRDRNQLNEVRPFMDVEAEITGFDPERVEEYITKYLESSEKGKDLIGMAKNRNIISWHDSKWDYGILQVPILLHMICVLYQAAISLPETMTAVISAIVERCPDWEEIRKSGRNTEAEMRVLLDDALVKLGKLCWKRLQQGNKDLIFAQASTNIFCLWRKFVL